jgi:peptidoglycan/LPS O-acetylase OafA/YrhL
MRNARPVARLRAALLVVGSVLALGLTYQTGDWYIFGAWWVVCLLAFPVCFVIALRKGKVRAENGSSDEGLR